MSVRGSLKTMPPSDVLEWLERRKLTGALALERAGTHRRFQIHSGTVTGASSTDPTEYLGQLLINAGLLTEEALRDTFAEQTAKGMLLGRILVSSGQVSEQALRETLELKISEGVYAGLSWEDGTFEFEPGAERRLIELEVALPLAPLLRAGAERATQWKAIRQLVPGDNARFFVPDRTWVDRAKPGSPSALILADVLQGLTVREIILERHALPFFVYQRLAELVQRGIIRLDRRAESREVPDAELPPPALIAAARSRARGGDKAGALGLARRALDAAPDSESIKKAYQELERALFAELSRTLLNKYRVPKLMSNKEELAAMALTPEERYLVGRIDGCWDLLSLMRVSPLREVEALITFHRLAERGVISLE